MEASTLTHASRRGLLARRSPLLRLQGDERLVALLRRGNDGAFEAIVDRYQSRLLGFCRQMVGSTEDAEDVLQEVFVNAYRAIMADNREIKLRPWLYRIARNRCLNHLRRPTAEGQDSMDAHPVVEAASTHEKVQNREEFRQIIQDVSRLPETQRSALLLREMDALSYEEIAQAMDTTVPSVKSLLVRARISLADSSQARLLTCGEVRVQLAEAAEGLAKASGPVRRHVRGCHECSDFRNQLRADDRVLSALFPVGPLVLVKAFIVSKLGLGGGATGGGAAGASAAGAGAAGAVGAAGASGTALATSSVAGGLGAVGGAIGTKTVAGVVTAAVLTAGAAVEVKRTVVDSPSPAAIAEKRVAADTPTRPDPMQAVITAPPSPTPAASGRVPEPAAAPEPAAPAEPVVATEPAPAPAEAEGPAPAEEPAPAPPAAEEEEAAGESGVIEVTAEEPAPAGSSSTAPQSGSGTSSTSASSGSQMPDGAAPPPSPPPASSPEPSSSSSSPASGGTSAPPAG